MPQGDAQRVWFPEMIEALRSQWRADMPFDAVISLRDDMDRRLQRIRSEGGIHSPVIKCRECGYRGEAAAPHVSVRAMILSLTRFDIAPAEQVYALEKSWAAYRKERGLDLYGKSPGSETTACPHPNARPVRL